MSENSAASRDSKSRIGKKINFLIVANKFQTGFDQSLLHTMYVDKPSSGVNAVQILSRLNRIHPKKTETMVLDFANEADAFRMAFAPYYEKTLLSGSTDPHLLYDLERRLMDFHVYDEADIASFATLYFRPKTTQDQLYAALAPSLAGYQELPEEERADFRGQLTDYVRLYAFLAQILTFADADLEKLCVFARLLRRYLPPERAELPREIQQNVDMDSYRVQPTHRGTIQLERGAGQLDPQRPKHQHSPVADAIELLSQIIHDLNERFGTDFSEEDRVVIAHLVQKLTGDPALATSVQVNTPENARLTFDHVVTDHLQDMVDTNFKFYKRVTDDQAFARFFLDWLFDQVQARLKGGE